MVSFTVIIKLVVSRHYNYTVNKLEALDNIFINIHAPVKYFWIAVFLLTILEYLLYIQ